VKGVGDPREPATFALVVLIGFVVAKFLAVAVHEILGHGLFTQVVGGTFYGVYVSPGSGFSMIFLPASAPVAASALVDMAGILVDILFGIAIFAYYPRVRTFLGRVFVLLLLQVFLVYSLLYLALGAFPGTEGDSAAAVEVLGAPYLEPAFLLLGLMWAVGVAYVLSAELARLVAPRSPLRRQLLYLGVFWFAPIAVGVVPGLASATGSLFLYFVLFLAVGGAVFAGTLLLASRLGPSREGVPDRPTGRFLPLIVAFAVVLPLWVSAFGLTDATAHGLLLQDPPLEAEPTLAAALGIDVQVDVAADHNATLVFRMKGLGPPDASPLEQQALATYDRRAYFPYWIGFAHYLAAGMTNASSWSVLSYSIDRNGTVWSEGASVGAPRIVVLGITDPEDLPRLATLSTNGSGTFLTMTVFDPFRAMRMPVPCDTCFLDEVNLTWPGGAYQLVSATASGSSVPQTGADYARFRNLTVTDAPGVYRLVLKVL